MHNLRNLRSIVYKARTFLRVTDSVQRLEINVRNLSTEAAHPILKREGKIPQFSSFNENIFFKPSKNCEYLFLEDSKQY